MTNTEELQSWFDKNQIENGLERINVTLNPFANNENLTEKKGQAAGENLAKDLLRIVKKIDSGETLPYVEFTWYEVLYPERY